LPDLIVLRAGASAEEIADVVARIEGAGLRAHVSSGEEAVIVGAIGDEAKLAHLPFEALPGVVRVLTVGTPWRLASRAAKPAGSVVTVGGASFGAGGLTLIAGPCTVEGREVLLEIAGAVRSGGAELLRGGAFKPRTSPYDFQGLGEEALELLAEARAATGLPVVTEVRNVRQVELVARYADMFQIGARNMQNFDLLREVGNAGKPVLLKRGPAATLKEFLMAAEYVLAGGNEAVVLCERGIRSVADEPRFTLDVSAVPILRSRTHLPVIVDPSHAAGKAALVPALARAAVAAGADGIIVEVHSAPEQALCDGNQAILPETFARLARELREIHALVRDGVGSGEGAGGGSGGRRTATTEAKN